MKKQGNQQKAATANKKMYQKPRIIHSGKIETLAGSCNATVSCTPAIS